MTPLVCTPIHLSASCFHASRRLVGACLATGDRIFATGISTSGRAPTTNNQQPTNNKQPTNQPKNKQTNKQTNKQQQQQLKTTSDVTSKFSWCCRASVLRSGKEALDVASDDPPNEALSCRRRARNVPYRSDGVSKIVLRSCGCCCLI